jgi:hypothetical protein
MDGPPSPEDRPPTVVEHNWRTVPASSGIAPGINMYAQRRSVDVIMSGSPDITNSAASAAAAAEAAGCGKLSADIEQLASCLLSISK